MPGTILIVEDEPAIRQMLGFALSGAGFACEQAGDGPSATRCGNIANCVGCSVGCSAVRHSTRPRRFRGDQSRDRLNAGTPKKRKKKLSGFLKRFQDATTALRDAVVVSGPDGEIQWANAAADYLAIRWPQDQRQRVIFRLS